MHRQRSPATARAPAAQNTAEIAYWLKRGGVAPGSPKMRQLLAASPDPQTVKAHVLERLAWVDGLVEGRESYGVGLLIRRILDGDPPPAMRCESCLRLPDKLGWCQCDYESVVKR